MLEVKVPVEIREYKRRAVLGFNIRQFISIICAAVIALVFTVLLSSRVSIGSLLWIILISVSPIIVWGFIPVKGMSFEKFLQVYVEYKTQPRKRIYEAPECCLLQIHEIQCVREIQLQRIENGELLDEEIEEESGLQS